MSRLQAPFQAPKAQNPFLVPHPAQVDINSGRGRFQQVNLGGSSAEERTRVPVKEVIVEKEEKVEGPFQSQNTTTTTRTTVVE